MSAPTVAPKRERGRFSLILQLGSSRWSNDTRSKNLPSSKLPVSSDTLPQSSSSSTRIPALHRDYADLGSADGSQSNTTFPLTEPDATEKANLLRKARKISRVFGGPTAFQRHISSIEENHLEAENVPFNMPDTSSQLLSSNDVQVDVPALAFSRASVDATLIQDANFVDTLKVFSHTTITTSPGEAVEHSAGSVIRPNSSQLSWRPTSTMPYPDENTPPDFLPWDQSGYQERRRQSLDIDFLAPPAPEEASHHSDNGKGSKRSLALWTSEARNVDNTAYIDEVLSERERLLNVKRARKMARVFGHDPPLELFHITHDIHERSLSPKDTNRDSIASSSSEASLSVASVKRPIPDLPASSSLIRVALSGDDIISEPHGVQSPSFQERRRRAAKLAQFFGVAYQDISSSLAVAEPTVSTASSERPAQLCVKDDDSPVHVDIKVTGRSRFWGRDNVREVNIVDARDRLRGLKAA